MSGAIGPLQELETDRCRSSSAPSPAINPLLDTAHPVTVGPFDGLHGWFFEHKSAQQQAMDRALRVVDEIDRDYAELSGRRYDLLDPYRMDDAEYRHRRDRLHGRRHPHGGRRAARQGRQSRHDPRTAVSPVPLCPVRQALGRLQGGRRLDRAESFGAQGGPLFLEVRAALYDCDPRPKVLPFIYGLGGRDIFPDNIDEAFAALRKAASAKKVDTKRRYLNLRKDEV